MFNNATYHFTDENLVAFDQNGSAYVNYIANVAFRAPNYKPISFFPAIFARDTVDADGFNVYMKDNDDPAVPRPGSPDSQRRAAGLGRFPLQPMIWPRPVA